MKITLLSFARITVMLTAIAVASVCQAQSEPETANTVVVSSMPTEGTFWSMQLTNYPPFPFDPLPELPLYTDGTPGNYFFDDLEVDYSALSSDRAAIWGRSSGTSQSMMTEDDTPPSPGGGSVGGHRSASVCHLGVIALRLGQNLQWNPQKERFVGDHANEANTWLAR